jgi:membrane peptidoglycan carboxypeptidase
MPISRVTTGDGKTVVAPTADKKNVMRPDVAYIMDDMMKDVINRGTAVDAHAWGITNSNGRSFAGKTGTSRDGWFAGFTPNLVCVVYVGFDDGSDLGMKGADSALPIWADFMQDALALHPDWNGDWKMPDGIRKGEIDIRTGKLIRELTNNEAETIKAQRDAVANSNTNSALPETPVSIENMYVTDVPLEFRRVELFIAGTMPNKQLLTEPTPTPDENNDFRDVITPSESPTPEGDIPLDELPVKPTTPTPNLQVEPNIFVMICGDSGLLATQFCPHKVSKKFTKGFAPRDYCPFHKGK